jgi:raffinose synthase
VAGVKVDGQAGAGLVGSALGGGPATAASFQAALEASVATHFDGNTTINCMCHSTENLFRMTGSALVRASDDFYPRDPASSAGHLAACAANSVFLAGVLTPDWDMFHSRHPAARAHAAARAASGGPVYVSDAPGCHDFSVLSSLVLEDGRVLRARLPGRPTPPTLFSDPTTDGTSLLTVWNVNDHTALVAVTHAQGSTWSRARRRFEVHDRSPPRLGTTVRPADLPLAGTRGGSAAARPWVAHVSGAAGLVLLPDAVDGVRVELGAGEAAMDAEWLVSRARLGS